MTEGLRLPEGCAPAPAAPSIPIGEGWTLRLPPDYRPTREHRDHDVPPGWVELMAYIPPHWCRVNHQHRLAPEAVQKKAEALWQLRQHKPGYQRSNPPKGYWEVEEDGRLVFVVSDGSHRWTGAFCLAIRPLLVRFNWPLAQLDMMVRGEREGKQAKVAQ